MWSSNGSAAAQEEVPTCIDANLLNCGSLRLGSDALTLTHVGERQETRRGLILSESPQRESRRSFAFRNRGEYEVGSVRANNPVPRQLPLYYFEVRVEDQGVAGTIGIGFTSEDFRPSRQPGWYPGSYGYHGDDGKAFKGSNPEGPPYGPTFGTGDVVGAGIDQFDQLYRKIFFTKNGQALGVAAVVDGETSLFPMIGMHSKGEKVKINFGREPFMFQDQSWVHKHVSNICRVFPKAFDAWRRDLYDTVYESRDELAERVQDLTLQNTELKTELEAEQAHVRSLIERLNTKQSEFLALKEDLERRLSATRSRGPSLGASTALRRYNLREMAAATENFAARNILGAGGFGTVYRGEIDHVPVAIKVLSEDGMQGRNEFDQEVEVHCRARHPYIVMLLGSCSDGKLCLVYDLMPNGNLEDRLLRAADVDAPPLTWQARVRIATEVATALLYLHSAPAPIIHRDVKPANILLDGNLTGKLADVGLAVIAPQLAPGTDLHAQTHISSPGGCGIGTFAYIDPEFMNEGRFGPASDVFSFGQVLLQLLTAKSPLGLRRTVSDALAHSSLSTVLDQTAKWPDDLATDLARLAVDCTETIRVGRPTLRERIVPVLSAMRARAAATETVDSSGAHGVEIPHKFLCPISRDIMEEPVLAADGYHYDRAFMSRWLENHNTSPLTNLELPDQTLRLDRSLFYEIREWKELHESDLT